MNKLFYPKLALQNIKKNGKFYFPYILASILTVAGFYNMIIINSDKALSKMPGADSLEMIMFFGTIVVALFSAIFLFYTNSFLMKRRQKEIGLYNILGMEKRHISKILAWECLFTGIISITVGILFGILLSKLMLLIIFKVLFFTVHFGFSVSLSPVILTVVLFGVIFALNLVSNLFRIGISKPIELLHGSSAGEREPKTKWVLTVIGLITLGIGYYIAITTESPLSAILLFFFAVLMVIIGTYCLFTAGSIALLKLLRKNKKYYYKTKHFISVSGMIYRMKQNAVGLANICILSTMVLVLISTTVCMYTGSEDALLTRYPYDVSFTANYKPENAEAHTALISQARKSVADAGLTQADEMEFRSMNFATARVGDSFEIRRPDNIVDTDVNYVCVIPAAELEAVMGFDETLGQSEVLAFLVKGDDRPDKIKLGDTDFTVKRWLDTVPFDGGYSTSIYPTYMIFVSDYSQMTHICDVQSDAYGIAASTIKWNYCYNMSGTDEQKLDCVKSLRDSFASLKDTGVFNNIGWFIDCRQENRSEFYAVYGGFLFLGIFLGSLFLMATALIIYYKQICEGYDDKERFEIMQKVGMTKSEVRRAIHSQVVTVFFLPLGAAIIHLAASFNLIQRILSLLALTDVTLFITCTLCSIAVFGAVYAIVYALTARVYYRIVS